MSSHCIFCAVPFPCTWKSEGGGGATVEDQFQGIFVLRNILGFGKNKVNKYMTAGEIEARNYPQVCGQCEEKVKECYEAVTEISKLNNKVGRISSELKERIYDSKREKGEGANSSWGRIRLDVLVMMAGGDEIQPPSKVSLPYEPPAGNYSTLSGISEVGNGEANQFFFPEGSNFTDEDEVLDEEEAEFGDPLIEVEEKVLTRVTQTLDTEENINEEEPCSTNQIVERRSTRIRPSKLLMEPVTSSEEEVEEVPDSVEIKNGTEERLAYSDKMRRQPDGFYHCPHCPKKFSCHRSRNSHKFTHSQKFVCKVCHQGYTTATKFRRHLGDNRCARILGKKRPCRHCGKHFSNLKSHEEACEERKERGVPLDGNSI